MTAPPLFAFDNSYARLPERFGARMPPAPVAAPRVLRVNAPVARLLGVDPAALATEAAAVALAGGGGPEGAEPLAMAYAGHQFGQFNPQLGDGRAVLLGEIVGADGVRRDLHLKGSGRTPFSRGGDGRAAIGPVLREFVVSEGMAALGVPTTRALAALMTGEAVYRERPLPGAVLARVAQSHVRVGTFQFFAARGDEAALRALVDYVVARHYPEAAEAPRPPLALLEGVIARQARLVARWMALGFIHGVMNTDNMSIAGETIDYGPCAFMDGFHPGRVFSSIDHGGRYAYGNQPRIAAWNLAKLAECLLPLIDADQTRAVDAAQAAVDGFAATFNAAWMAEMRAKLGLGAEREEDRALIDALLEAMAEVEADFTLTFRRLSHAAAEAEGPAPFEGRAAADWAARWRARLASEGRDPAAVSAAMLAVNPAAIPRNHQVERALEAAEEGDLAPFDALVEAVCEPFVERPGYMAPPTPEQVVRATFCGT